MDQAQLSVVVPKPNDFRIEYYPMDDPANRIGLTDSSVLFYIKTGTLFSFANVQAADNFRGRVVTWIKNTLHGMLSIMLLSPQHPEVPKGNCTAFWWIFV